MHKAKSDDVVLTKQVFLFQADPAPNAPAMNHCKTPHVLVVKCDPNKYAVHFFAEKRLPVAIFCYLWVSHMSKILSQDTRGGQQVRIFR